MPGKTHTQSHTRMEWLHTLKRAAEAIDFMHRELDLSDETYIRLLNNIKNLTANDGPKSRFKR